MGERNPLDCLTARLEIFRRTEPGLSLDSETFARMMDEEDPLATFRAQFEFPRLGSIPVGRLRLIYVLVMLVSQASPLQEMSEVTPSNPWFTCWVTAWG